MTSTPENKKIAIKGGCHCGFITYTAHTTLTPRGTLSAIRCNCTFCQNLGYTSLHLSSPADFTLHSPPSLTTTGPESKLGDYAPRVKTVHRYFCRECGSHVWMQGEYPLGDGNVMPVLAVNLGTVKVEALPAGVDLRRTEIGYYDMLSGDVRKGLRVEGPWEGGLV